MKAISYVQSLRNRLEAIDALMHESYEKGPPFPPELWVKQMRQQQATLNKRILEIQNLSRNEKATA